MLPPALGVVHRLHALAELAVGAGGGDVDGIHPPLFQQLADLQAGVGVVALGADVFLQRHPDHEGEVPAAGGPDGVDDLFQDAGAVFQAAAVFVPAVVGDGAEKAVDEVVVGGVDLHPVQAAFLDPAGGLAELPDQGGDLLPAGLCGLAPVFPPALGGGEQGGLVQPGVGVGAGVEELGKDLGARDFFVENDYGCHHCYQRIEIDIIGGSNGSQLFQYHIPKDITNQGCQDGQK